MRKKGFLSATCGGQVDVLRFAIHTLAIALAQEACVGALGNMQNCSTTISEE